MSTLAFVFGAGLLVPVNACGFAMLPAFLAYYSGEADAADARRGLLPAISQGLVTGGAVSLGFAGVYVTAGLLVSAGLRPLMRYVPWAAVVIGMVLVGLGIAMMTGRHVGLRATGFRPGEGRALRRMVVFGAAYAVASLSCSLAILLAVVARALATDSPVGMVAVLVAYGLGSATLLTTLSVSAALAKGTVARLARRVVPVAGRLGGGLLALAGAYLVAYWLPVVAGSRRAGALGWVSEASARLTALLDANRGWFAVLAVVLTGVGLYLWRASVGARHQVACCDSEAGDVEPVAPAGPRSPAATR